MKRSSLFFSVLMLACASALAAPPVFNTFSVSPSSGPAPLSASLTWNVSGAAPGSPCVGSGAWSGTKAASGTQAITVSADSTYTLTCTAADGSAVVSWMAPTKNTDNSTLVDLASFKVLYGNSATALNQSVPVPSPTATSQPVTSLLNGTYFFTVRAVNSKGVESDNGNVASKAVAGSTSNASAVVTIDKKPAPPTGITVASEVVAGMNMTPVFRYNETGRTSEVLGFVSNGTACNGPVRFRYRDKAYRDVPASAVKFWSVQPATKVAAFCAAPMVEAA